MDEDQARAALTEVDRRRDEVVRLAGRESAPRWFALVAAVVILALAVVTDVRLQVPEWNGWFTRWVVPLIGLAVIGICGWVVYRRATVTAHSSATGRQMAEIAVALVAYYLLAMAIGMPMRYYDVPFDQTVSTLGAGVLVLVGWLVWRRVVARRG
jgi:cation transport ATPase